MPICPLLDCGLCVFLLSLEFKTINEYKSGREAIFILASPSFFLDYITLK